MPIVVTESRYNELLGYSEDATLLRKVEFAVVVAAEAIKSAAAGEGGSDPALNTADHRLWARYVIDGQQSRREAVRTLRLLLAENKAATDAQIEAAVNDDATLQGLVTNIVQGYSVQARADR